MKKTSKIIDLAGVDYQAEKCTVSKEALYDILELLNHHGVHIERCEINDLGLPATWKKVSEITRCFHPGRYRIILDQ